MTIKELIKQLEDMQLLYGDKVILTVIDGELDYRVKDINDCISREAVFKIFDDACYIDSDWYVMRERIEKLPSVTPTRPKGKWKILDECANEGVYCSKCHKTVFKLDFSHTMKWRNFKYCPNCGAKMEVEE